MTNHDSNMCNMCKKESQKVIGGDLSVRRLSREGVRRPCVAERNSKHGSKACYLGTA